MKSGGVFAAAILAVVLVVSAGCNQVIQNPVPTVKAISPASTISNGATFTLTVTGKNFVFGGAVLWNGAPISTLYVNSGELQATIMPSQITAPGPVPVEVFNPSPGGGASNQLNFTVNPAPTPVPGLTSLQPAATQVSGNGFVLVVNGSNFTPTSVVTWNGANQATTYVNNTQLQASITSTDIQDPGAVQVAVLNTQPGGGLSNSIAFDVDNRIPGIASVTPTTAIAGASGFTLTVSGGGFSCQDLSTTTTTNANGSTSTTTSCPQSDSVIEWNGVALNTTYDVNGQTLTATVNTAQLNEAGTSFVTVFNPAPGGGTSPAVFFQVIPGANGEGLPALVDVSSNGAQANEGIGNLGSSGPVIAGGGRFIAFSSVSQNLVANLSNAVANVFLRDTCLGISSGCSPQTLLVSQANDGEAANASSLQPSISSDGRYIAFSSAATNLAAGVPAGANEVYLRDTCLGAPSGCSPSTTLVSVGSDGVSPANGSSSQPSLSPDGHYVAFVSTGTNLVSNAATGAAEIYVRSTCLGVSGCTPTTTLASLASDGSTPADGTSEAPVVASGGRYVAFQSTGTNLVSIPSSGTQQLYWRDTCLGATGCTPSTSLVSIGSDGASPGNGASGSPAMSSDGRYVVFQSQATNLIGAGFVSGTPQQIYERDTCAGAASCSPSTSLVSVATDGSSPANGLAEQPSTDQTGRYVIFASSASNLTSAATNGFEQLYARDTCSGAAGCTPQTLLVSIAANGALGNGNSLYSSISTQAGFCAYLSFANNIVSDDIEPNFENIFLAVTGF